MGKGPGINGFIPLLINKRDVNVCLSARVLRFCLGIARMLLCVARMLLCVARDLRLPEPEDRRYNSES